MSVLSKYRRKLFKWYTKNDIKDRLNLWAHELTDSKDFDHIVMTAINFVFDNVEEIAEALNLDPDYFTEERIEKFAKLLTKYPAIYLHNLIEKVL